VTTESRLRKQFTGQLQRDGKKLEQVTLTVIDRPVDDRHRTWTTVTKIADESKTSDTTFADDAELTFPVEASKTYLLRGAIFFSTSATPDFKFQFTGPTSPTDITVRGAYYFVTGASGTGSRTEFVDIAFSVSHTVAGTNTGDDGYVEFHMRLENGSNAGEVALQWAQFISDAASTSVLAGSYIEALTVT
jgi:hypothetical protein